MYYHDTLTTSSGYLTTPSSLRTTTQPIIYITTPRYEPASPPAPPPPSYMTPPTTNRPSYLPSYNYPSTSRGPSLSSDTLLPNCCKTINIMLSSTCYEYQHSKMGTYTLINNRLKYRSSNVTQCINRIMGTISSFTFLTRPGQDGW